MRALLDVNVLIALLDGSHVHHKQVIDAVTGSKIEHLPVIL